MFDRDRVQFTDVELDAAEALDAIYEAIKYNEGFDIVVVAEQITNIQDLIEYLTTGEREDLANRLFGLGVMFVRDNVDLSAISDDDTE